MKKFIGFLMAALTMTSLAFAEEAVPVGPSDYSSILAALTGQISVSSIVGVLAAAIGASIGFVFLWWAVRKLLATFFSGFRKGKASV